MNLNRVALSATIHCLTGCAIGEVLGMIIGTALGWSDWQTIALAVALHPTSTASTVRLRDGELLVTDGPYAEITEVVGGFYVLRSTPDAIVELAGAIPVPDGGGVEVRPVMEIDG